MGRINCCHDCSNRAVGCHGICEKYIESRKKYEEQQTAIYAWKNKDKAIQDYKHSKRYKGGNY